MNLNSEIEAKKKEISTDGYPMSIGELISLYKENALDVHPEFQRFFRWNILQKSTLIESILLGIPIPSIFVSQRKNGVWDVVDGQQRLSTIFEFVGVLKDNNGAVKEPSKLAGTKYLPSLQDMQWENSDLEKSFGTDLQFIFKREKIDIKIVKRESDENVKFELFQRLNTLGSKLSDQEVRNCLLVMLNQGFYNWLIELSQHPAFVETTSLADRLIEEQYNLELILRFLILKNMEDLNEIKNIQDLGEFITEKMIKLCSDPNFDRDAEKDIFLRTFEILNVTIGSNAFKKYNLTKAKFEGSFIISAFEAVAIALGRNIHLWHEVVIDGEVKGKFVENVKSIFSRPDYQSSSGSGVNVSRRVPFVIPIGQELLRP
jgi:uncharacterized protein with ParB-like and HNH nuclease domain